MSIYLNKNSRVIVQGMTGSEGSKHTDLMIDAGTHIVGGVNKYKPDTVHRTKHGYELAVFASVAEAMKETEADISVMFVPPQNAKEAMLDAINAEISVLVVITEGIPVHDIAYVHGYNQHHGNKTRIIGPNCPGIITPGQALAGIIPANISGPGPIGLVSKSGTLTYQIMSELGDIGFSTAIGIGGDPIVGTTQIDVLAAFEMDEQTELIIMIGEIGGDAEECAAQYVCEHITKPVIGYVAGYTAPEGKTMGHAGAIISGSSGRAQAKKRILESCGISVGRTPAGTAQIVREKAKAFLNHS